MLTEIVILATGTAFDIHFSIFVTCLSTSNWTVLPLYTLFCETTGLSRPSSLESAEMEGDKPFSAVQPHAGGGIVVCASGPESLVVETRNAVARLGVGNALKLGGVVVHVESFAL
ncbi:hypothetical protein F5J12DRAFT_849863 [Pisolithus orientalis]|uniref:uncharacterized protein n=1 Tax=Pisolithus orientalis TaxID=936130 RepID=UPI00222529C2|nr:uncharacterized protein F5J12DRAFT_849863 [Pisolithus orientalis]KAI5998357.1 hypothetical protein F5J12DRAFT_849863 [Pisolithus orientalis]